MPTTNESMHTALQAQQLLPISARLTTGSFVMVTEGVAATIGFMMPRNHWLYLAGLLITLAFLGGAELFRRFSKVGADISDLFFWDAVIWAGITANKAKKSGKGGLAEFACVAPNLNRN